MTPSGALTLRLAALVVLLLLLPIAGAQAADKPLPGQFLLVSDIHFNPMADPALLPELVTAAPEQWEPVLQRSKLPAYSQYGSDTNWWLLQSALDQMQATLPHPAFIVIAGDFLAHEFPQNFGRETNDKDHEHYRAFVLKTVEFLAFEFRKRYPDTKILVTPGNNDEECGNYSIRANGIFLGDTAELARSLAQGDVSFAAEWKALGSYNIPHPALPGVRIIALNTVFFSNNYHADRFSEGCMPVASSGPPDLLLWLEKQLAQAKAAHEKVWLMFHIPPGMDGFTTTKDFVTQLMRSHSPAGEVCAKAMVPMWVPRWTEQFDKLLEKYRDTVIASFAGHTHTDDFRVIGPAGSERLFILIDPPISPVYGQNPAFRVVTFAPDGTVADHSTYYLTNLEKASTTVAGVWRKEYTFSEQWKLKGVDAPNLAKLYDQIKSDPEVRDEWFKLYNVSSSNVSLPDQIARGLYCAAESLDPATYQTCYCPVPKPRDTERLAQP